jgi:hypothetical protein
VKVTRHALDRAIERHGISGTKRKRRQKVNAAVKEAIATGVVCYYGPLVAQVVHPDGRRWIVDMQVREVITSLPPLRTSDSRKERT